jgi:hypothetical protein
MQEIERAPGQRNADSNADDEHNQERAAEIVITRHTSPPDFQIPTARL